jgi:hypothetical protein
MAHSSLLGIDRISPTPAGHDTATLGPSDSSDSGSDVAGLADLDDGDPGMPVDVATRPDRERPDSGAETVLPGVDTDAAGTGERRSAGSDAGLREAFDIAPDRVVSMTDAAGGPELQVPDVFDELDGVPLASDGEADEDDEEDEDEDADPVGDPNTDPVSGVDRRDRRRAKG